MAEMAEMAKVCSLLLCSHIIIIMILIWHKSPIIMNWSLQLMHNSNLITEHS